MKHAYRLISLILLLLATVSVRAETIDCTAITSLPYVITTQGVYCLTGNLSTSMTKDEAITINTNNVTIDLNGYKLGGLGAGTETQVIGIYANQRKNITIKNGIVRGFYEAIYLRDVSPYTTSSGHVIKNILADQNTYAAFQIEGLGNTVSHNTVVDTGSSIGDTWAVGIIIAGSGAKVVNNNISKTTAESTGRSTGLNIFASDYSLVQNNTVTDTLKETGISVAISIYNSNGVFLRNNNIANADYGLYFDNSTGKYFNNLTFDVSTPFTGGTPIGNNNN